MVSRRAARRGIGQGQVGHGRRQQRPIGLVEQRPPPVVLGQPGQLRPADGRPNLVDAIVVAGGDNVVAEGVAAMAIPGESGHAVGTQQPQPLGQAVVAGRHHAALTGGHVLVSEEAEAADAAPCAQRAAVERRAGGVGHIFDNVQPVAFGQGQQGGHVGGVAAVVDDDERPRVRRDARRHVGRRQAQVVGAADVGEDGRGPGVAHGVGRGHEGQRGHDYLVARPPAQRQPGQVQRGGAVGDGQGVARPGQRGELRLEGHRHAAHRQPAAAQHIEHGRLFLRPQVDVGQGNAPHAIRLGHAPTPPPPDERPTRWPNGPPAAPARRRPASGRSLPPPAHSRRRGPGLANSRRTESR